MTTPTNRAARKLLMVEPGSVAPDFTLPDGATGEERTLAELSAGHDTLLVFFRGTWCPFCRDQMTVLAENEERLRRAEVRVVGVVCQGRGSVGRFLAGRPLPFPLLCDERRTVARTYGTHYWLAWEGAHLSHPALFVLDTHRRVTFAHVGRGMADLPVSAILEKILGSPNAPEPKGDAIR